MVFAVILVRVLSAGNPDVKELNSQQFKQAVEDKAFVTNLSETDPNTLAVKDEDQTVTGLLKENGQQQEFEYSYPEYYDIADVFNDANIPFTTDPQNTGFWLTLLGTLGPILLIIRFFILFMSSMQGGGNRVMSFGKSRARRMTKDQSEEHTSELQSRQYLVCRLLL